MELGKSVNLEIKRSIWGPVWNTLLFSAKDLVIPPVRASVRESMSDLVSQNIAKI